MGGSVRTEEVVALPDGRLDAKNAATYCGLAVKTMAIMRCKGNGPKFVRIGRIFYFRTDLDSWIDRERFVSTSQAQCSRRAAGGAST